MINVYNRVMYGNTYKDNEVPKLENDAVIKLTGTSSGEIKTFGLNYDDLSKHSLFIGGTGCGKTNLFKHFVKQIKANMSSNDVMIIFDSKGDFYNEFHSFNDLVIGNSNRYRNESQKWNLFREILIDGNDEKDYYVNSREICKAFFEDRIKNNSSNSFFPNAACELLDAIILTLIKAAVSIEDKKLIYRNEFLMKVLKQKNREEICELLEDSLCDDVKYVLSYIKKDSGQSQGVISELYSVVNELLVGVFAENGGFSIRDFVRSKQGKTLFIEYDLAVGSTFSPIYSLLFDLALKESLSREESTGNVFLICDEFRLIPNLKHIDNAVNFGRSLNVKVIAGLQSINQLYEVYGIDRGKSIAAGFSSIYAFHANDVETREYFYKLSGKNISIDSYYQIDGTPKDDKRDGFTVEDWDINSLIVGEAFVSLPFSSPFRFKFDEY